MKLLNCALLRCKKLKLITQMILGCQVIVNAWFEKTTDASWSQLVVAINKINMHYAAKVIG